MEYKSTSVKRTHSNAQIYADTKKPYTIGLHF